VQSGSRSPGIDPWARGVCVKPALRGGLIAPAASLLDVRSFAEERGCVGEEVVGECAEERDAADLLHAAAHDVGGAVLGFEVRVDELDSSPPRPTDPSSFPDTS
jgi:hypothetical protein